LSPASKAVQYAWLLAYLPTAGGAAFLQLKLMQLANFTYIRDFKPYSAKK